MRRITRRWFMGRDLFTASHLLNYNQRVKNLARTQMQSVSPFRENFKEYLDPNIADLVLTLVRRGYYILYSCEGHSLTKPRYIALAFSSKSQREIFKQNISIAVQSKFLSFKDYETLSREVINGREYVYETIQSEVMGINNLFRVNHSEYCFLKVYIGEYIDTCDDDVFLVRKEIKIWILFVWIWLVNLYVREKLTKKITHFFGE